MRNEKKAEVKEQKPSKPRRERQNKEFAHVWGKNLPKEIRIF